MDLVRAVVNERDVIDVVTCEAWSSLLVIELMSLKSAHSQAGAGSLSVVGTAASTLAVDFSVNATASESPNFAPGQAEERA